MKQILINVLYALLLVAVLCFCYFLVVYVLGQLGWTPPIMLLRIAFIGLALFAAILILSGRANKWM